MDNNQLEFDKAYWAAQPPEARALPAVDEFELRVKRAAELAAKGFVIDVPIMVWGWDPYLVMKMRSDYGYTWVPSALQPNISVAPGVTQPGSVPYDPTHAPEGSIRVSTNIADYPPFDPPVPPAQQNTSGDPVGLQSLGNLYLSVPGEVYPDGAKFSDARGTFLKHVALTPFGRSNYWEKVA